MEDSTYWRQAVQSYPDDPTPYYNLGICLAQARHYSEAAGLFEKALTLLPTEPRVHNALGFVLNKQGRNAEAITCFREALRLDPSFIDARNNLVYYLHFDYACSPQEMLNEHKEWVKYHVAKLPQHDAHPNIAEPDKILKIGYISADFRTHSVAYFFEALLSNHNPTQVEITCYANIDNLDQVSQRIAASADHWHVVHSWSDDEMVTQILADEIDILVDLGGHTTNNRLGVFARKPAPIQVSWLGYPDTTGLPSIDYRITDAWADPPGVTDQWHTEELLRLQDGFLCYQPPSDTGPIASLPSTTLGAITFGSYNALPKITPPVIRAWASILTAVPGARLVLKNQSFVDQPVQQRYHTLFEAQGIAPERIDLLGWLPGLNAHMESYARIDIALDTFPYNGTTTSCEALWMGVPVLALSGMTHVERVGVSLLSQLGLQDWIAKDVDDYIHKAIDYAHKTEELIALRKSMRDRMQSSSLCDAPAFANNMEQTYRTIWKKWCAQPSH